MTGGETVNSSAQLYDWINNVTLASTGADIAFNNTGGIRSNGNIVAGEGVSVGQVYEIFPFDNTLWVMEMTYEQMSYLFSSAVTFYNVADGVTLQSGQTYTVAINSYMYYWNQTIALHSSNDINTGILFRDILIEDLTIKGENGELFYPITDPYASVPIQVSYPTEVSFNQFYIYDEKYINLFQ